MASGDSRSWADLGGLPSSKIPGHFWAIIEFLDFRLSLKCAMPFPLHNNWGNCQGSVGQDEDSLNQNSPWVNHPGLMKRDFEH